MDDRARTRIRIEEDELSAPTVDALLAQQVSFGMARTSDRVPDRKTPLLYRPWFALMIAGALGGLAGWAIVEPFLHDGLRLDGAVEQVSTEPLDSGALRVRVAGIDVFVVSGVTRVVREGAAVSADDVATASHVAATGHLEGEILFAHELEILSDPAPEGSVSPAALVVRSFLVSWIVFPIVAGLVGVFVAAADALLSRALRRGAICALVGLSSGLVLGLVTSLVGDLVYWTGSSLVLGLSADQGMGLVAYLTQMVTRGLAWAAAGTAMGLGQGIALRSRRMALNGIVGGVVGALVGGLLFDPIASVLHGNTVGMGGEASRAVGFMMIGLTTGLMIGIVELLARDAWLKMLAGPLAGKEFVLFKNPTSIGSSPKSDIYLFKDAEVEPTHALVHALGEGYEIEDRNRSISTFLNGRPVRRARLEHGDQIRIGKTVLAFSVKEG